MNAGYPVTTRAAVRYLPVTRRGSLIGYLWASLADDAASFHPLPGDPMDRLGAAAAWESRLHASYQEGLTPLQALRRWKGAPEDPAGGGIAAGAAEGDAPDHATMVQRLIDPDYVERPFDWREAARTGQLPDGTPLDRGEGWEPLSPFVVPPSYPTSTDASVRYLPVLRAGTVVGYLWASTDEKAADYIRRKDAGLAGFNTAGHWTARLRQAKQDGLRPSQALRRWAGRPEDAHAGQIPADAVEGETPSLAALAEHAGWRPGEDPRQPLID